LKETEARVFKEQKSLIELVKSKHASLDKLLASMLQQSSGNADSSVENLDR